MPKHSFKLSKRIGNVSSCPRRLPDERDLRDADVCGTVRVHHDGYVNLTVTEVRLTDGRRFRRGNGLEELLTCVARSFAHRRRQRAVSPASWQQTDRGVQLGAHVTLRSEHKTFERRKVCMQVEKLLAFKGRPLSDGRRRKWLALQLRSDLFDDPFLHVTMAQLH